MTRRFMKTRAGRDAARSIRRRFPGHPRAFSLAEVMVSLVLVSGLLAVSLNTVGGAALARRTTSDHGIGQLLGMALMSEIMDLSYADPDETPVFGAEASEVDPLGSRKKFDDVDDYHNLSESVAAKKAGGAYANRTGWRRTVTIVYVRPDDLTQTAIADQGFKRITVAVYRNNALMATIVGVRSGAVQAILKAPVPEVLIEDPLDFIVVENL